MRKSKWLLVPLLALLFAGCGGISRFSREPLMKAPKRTMELLARAGDRNTYPNANYISVEDVDSVIFDSTGMSISYSYGLMKAITMAGAKDLGEIPLGYDSQMMLLDILYARVIHPDGTVEYLPDSAITDGTLPGYSEMDIYWSNLRMKTLHFPMLSMGDAIEIAYKYTSLQPRFKNFVSNWHTFQSTIPAVHSRSVVVGPSSMPLNWKVFNDPDKKVTFEQKKKGNKIKYVWDGWDFPQIISEPQMVSVAELATSVAYSTGTWRELSRKAAELSEPKMKAGDEIVAKVHELTDTLKTERQKLRALAYFVMQDVRYIGLSLGAKEGITPHDVNKTFEDKAGVCKDKAALLTSMLRVAGIEAYDVLTNPMNRLKKEVAAEQFNHMIVIAYLKDGSKQIVDVTDEICRDMLPAYYSYKSYLVMDEEGDTLKQVPLIPAEKSMGQIIVRSSIDENGTLYGAVTITGNGLYDEVLRTVIRMQDKIQQRRMWERMVHSIHPEAKLISYTVEPEPITDLYQAPLVSVQYEIPNYAIVAGDYLLLKSPLADGAFNLVGAYFTEFAKLDERTYPIDLMFTIGTHFNEKMAIPSGYTIKVAPDPASLDYPPASFVGSYELKGDTLIYDATVKIKQPRISVEDYSKFKDVSQEYQHYGDGMVILEKKGGA